MSDLPKDYDVIIVGTGITESIVAAALSRIGKIVLHIDRNKFYGGEFSSHNLTSLIEWSDKLTTSNLETNTNEIEKETDEKNTSFKCNNNLRHNYKHFEHNWNSSLNTEDKNFKEEVLKLSRRFNIDLAPNILFSAGPLVKLLVSSEVSKYCEFQIVTHILTIRDDGTIEKVKRVKMISKRFTKITKKEKLKVPTSRSEVFKSDKLNMIEKRHMMQFVQSILKENDFKDLLGDNDGSKISFKDFINNKKLPSTVSHYLLNAVSMSAKSDHTALEGLGRIRKFLKSVGIYGESPFLFCQYGAGELPQCFCRMAAVFGAIYYLSLTIDKIYIDNESNLVDSISVLFEDEASSNTVYNCKHLIIDSSYAPRSFFKNTNSTQSQSELISRCVLITDKSIFKQDDKKNNVSIMYLPNFSNSPEIYLIETSSVSQCCPDGYYLVYLMCKKQHENTKDDFSECINLLFNAEKVEGESGSNQDENNKPNIIFSYYYSHLDSRKLVENEIRSGLPENLYAVAASDAYLDYDYHVSQAEKIFRTICPTDEFMPKPPDPEDIILDFQNEEETPKEPSKTNEQTSNDKKDISSEDK